MLRRVLFALALLWGAPAAAQSIQQSGTVTAGHVFTWVQSGVGRDAGAATNPYSLEMGLFKNGGLPFCIVASTIPRATFNPNTSPHTDLCFYDNQGGQGGFTLTSYNGAAAANFVITLNGTNYSFPASGTGTGNVTGPNSSTVNDIVVFNSVNGQLIADSGIQISSLTSLVTVGTIAALRANATVPTNGVIYVRGYYSAGDGGQGMFVNQPGSSATDNGGTLIVDASSNRWQRDIAGNAPYSLAWFGATGSVLTTTGTISGSSAALALSSAQDFQNGEGIRVDHAGAAFTATAPTGLAVVNVGTAGSTTVSYQVACLDNAGGVGKAITAATTTTSNATLSVTNYNKVTWAAGAGCTAYMVWSNFNSAGYAGIGTSYAEEVASAVVAAGGTGYLVGDLLQLGNGVALTVSSVTAGAVTGVTIAQNGMAATPPAGAQAAQTGNGVGATFTLTWHYVFYDTAGGGAVPEWIPSTPTGAALADWLVTTILSGGGTTSLTLAATATTGATGTAVLHDDTARVVAAMATGNSVAPSAGATYQMTSSGLIYSGANQKVICGGTTFLESGGGYDFATFGSGVEGQELDLCFVDSAGKVNGHQVFSNSSNRAKVVGNTWNNSLGGALTEGGTGFIYRENRTIAARGTSFLHYYGPGSTSGNVATAKDNTFRSVQGFPTAILWDGDFETLTLDNNVFLGDGSCFEIQNTVGGAKPPNFLLPASNQQCNNSNFAGATILGGGGFYTFSSSYFQARGTNNASNIIIGINTGPVVLDTNQIFGAAQHGVENWGLMVTAKGNNIYANSNNNSGIYSGIWNAATSNITIISGGASGADASNPDTPTDISDRQLSGVYFAPGAQNFSVQGVTLVGNVIPYIDASAGWPGNGVIKNNIGSVSESRFSDKSGITLGQTPEIQPAATNLIIQSSAFDNAAWTKSNITVTAAATVDPFGGTNAELLAMNTTANTLFDINQHPTLADNTLYWNSCYFKQQAAGFFPRLNFTDKANGTWNTVYNLQGSGASINAANTFFALIQKLQGSWYHGGQVIFSASGVTTPRAQININNSNKGSASFPGTNGSGIYGASCQLEALAIQAATTGTIATGDNILTVSSATGWQAGYRAMLVGAGAGGIYEDVPIISVSGTTVTLAVPGGIPTGISGGEVVAFAPQNPTDPIPTAATSVARVGGAIRCDGLGIASGATCGPTGITVP